MLLLLLLLVGGRVVIVGIAVLFTRDINMWLVLIFTFSQCYVVVVMLLLQA